MDAYLPYIAVPLVFGLLKWTMPYKERTNIDELKLAENAKKYSKYELFSILPLFVYLIIVPYLFYLLGANLFFNLGNDANTIHFYTVDKAFWPVVGLFFAFGTIMSPMNKLYEILLGEEYDLYLEYANRKHGFDAMRFWQPFSYLLILSGGVVMFLGLNTHFTVTEDKIIVNPFFALNPVETSFSEVERIVLYQKAKAPNGAIKKNEHYVIYKKDDAIILDESFKLFGIKEPTINHILKQCKLTLEQEDLRVDQS